MLQQFFASKTINQKTAALGLLGALGACGMGAGVGGGAGSGGAGGMGVGYAQSVATGARAGGGATVTASSAGQEVKGTQQRPNVLLILADDLGWSDLGCMGGEINTPNLDALAHDGLCFTEFYNSARCCPSRASLLTGLHPHQAGFPLMSGVLSEHAVTLPEVLKSAGYNTYMVGKWHLSAQSNPVQRGFDEFYGMLGGFNSYWQEHPYYSRLPADHPVRPYAPGEFYSTNAFGDYALDFIDQGQQSGKPWMLYLAFNAVHFPLHAPENVIAKYEQMYFTKGWDAIREERLARQKKLGLVPQNLQLTPRSIVPKNFINVQTGWADKQNPAWDSLPPDRRHDLARRMAVYAAIAEIMDTNIGRVVGHLKATGQLDNTVIFFLSDNGACAEWDPWGFDQLDSPKNIVHTGAALKEVGAPSSYVSYGSGWANASNTPWRLYKHYAQEGGIRTSLIVHWPAGLKTKPGTLNVQPGYLTDFMPTLVELCGATYPAQRNGQSILPQQGISLAPALRGEKLPPRAIYVEHEGNRMVRAADWKLVALADKPWELYNVAHDPTEMHDLATQEPQRVQQMSANWDAWAARSMVNYRPAARPATPTTTAPTTAAPTIPTPQIANKALTITCTITLPAAPVTAPNPSPQTPNPHTNGVLLAQGGHQRGYALHLHDGQLIFSVRQNEKLYTATAPLAPIAPASSAATDSVPHNANPPASSPIPRLSALSFDLEAHLEKDGTMTLAINGQIVARGKAPGVFTTQPQDELSIGEDTLSAVGDYTAPNPFAGKVEKVQVRAE